MRPGISYTADGSPFMKNPGSFAFSRATPKSSDRQQGPLAEPPQQTPQQPAPQRQAGGNQASGNYSAYSPGSGFSAYASPMDKARSYGYSGPGSSPMERMPTLQPPQGGPQGSVMIGGLPAAVLDPRAPQREIDRLKQRGTWDDPRNAKARERLEQQLADAKSVPPGYFRTPDGRLEPNYIGTLGGPQQPPAPPGYVQNPDGSLVLDYISIPPFGRMQQPPAPQSRQAPPRPPEYGTRINLPPGVGHFNDWVDSDSDGVDDRFQRGPGMPSQSPQLGRQPPAPKSRQAPPRPPNYGTRINLPPGVVMTQDVVDSDRDGVDDRFQRGPGMPSQSPQLGRQPPAPKSRQAPPRPPNYGTRINLPPGVVMTQDVVDSDRDGVDDRYQRGPGMPSQAPGAPQIRTNYAPPQSFVMPTPMTPQGMPDFRQRDAFIASINNSLGQQMSFGTPTPQPPQLNFPTLWQQAGQMVNNGWQNPLAGLFM